MKRPRHWLWNATQAISLALLAATIAAWIYFAIHPWSGSLQFVHYGPRSYINPADAHGHWALIQDQDSEIGDQDCAWQISLDQRSFHISPLNSFYYWKIGWWKFLLLWLVPTLLRYLPWRTPRQASQANLSSQATRWGWLLHGPPAGRLPWRSELKNIAIAHCQAAYSAMTLWGVACLVENWFAPVPDSDRSELLIFGAIFALAPVTAPALLLLVLQEPPLELLNFATVASLAYLCALLGIYFRRTNRLLHPKRNLAILH